jgi:polar amino acid transport system substrate-binding protein
MMKRLTVLSAAIAGLCGLAGAAHAQSCEPKLGHPPLVRKGVMIAAINPTVAPIQYVNDDGEIVGLDVDLGNAIAAKLCLKMQFQSTQFATMIPILKEGRIDLINSFMFYTPERAAQVLMVPYGASTAAILVSKKNTDEIKGLEYFSGKSFATELGTVDYQEAKDVSEALVKAGKPAIDVRTFSTYADVLQALKAGQVAGAFIGVEEAAYYKSKGADFFRVAIGGLIPHAEALAFKDPGLAEAVVKVMNEMKADGSFDKIFAPYDHCVLPGPYKVTSGPLPPYTCPNRKD